MTKPMWKNLLMGIDAAALCNVFSGGACNVITATGSKARGASRDSLNSYLDQQDIRFFDPQIHEDTHGRGYDDTVDAAAEQAARAAARVTLYEIGDGTLAGVTCLEAKHDADEGKNVVIWLSGSEFDAKGRPIFTPAGNPTSDDPVAKAHLGEYVKTGTALRRNLVSFTKDKENVRIVKTEAEAIEAIEQFLSEKK